MTVQVAVRLPNDLVDFMDHLIEDGAASSRATVVASALRHEQRRLAAERDAAILAAYPNDPDMDALAVYGTQVPIELD